MSDLVVMTDTMLYVPEHLLYDEDLGEASEQTVQTHQGDPAGPKTDWCPSSEQRWEFSPTRTKARPWRKSSTSRNTYQRRGSGRTSTQGEAWMNKDSQFP